MKLGDVFSYILCKNQILLFTLLTLLIIQGIPLLLLIILAFLRSPLSPVRSLRWLFSLLFSTPARSPLKPLLSYGHKGFATPSFAMFTISYNRSQLLSLQPRNPRSPNEVMRSLGRSFHGSCPALLIFPTPYDLRGSAPH